MGAKMFCSNCGSSQIPSAKFCSSCGTGLVDTAVEPAETTTRDEPGTETASTEAAKKKNPLATILILVAVLVVGGIAIGSQAGNQSTSTVEEVETPTIEPTPEPINWAPSGYSQWDDSIAYKFTTKSGKWPCQDCNFWKVTVVANQGCPGGVYGELNMLDSRGTVQDWTNDSIPYLGPGEKAVLKFTHYNYDSSLKTGELTNLTCHG